MPLNNRIFFATSNRLIFEKYEPRYLVDDYKDLLERTIEEHTKYLEKHCPNIEPERIVSDNLTFSKTAQNCFNFITKQEEETLKNMTITNIDISSVAKLIYIMINEDFREIFQDQLINNLFDKILSKYDAESLSKMK